MTYEEYKESKKVKKSNIFKVLLSKLFTVVIFSMIVIICSNTNASFRNFLINDVLNSTMDFSKVNRLLNYFNLSSEEETENVFSEELKEEKYKDGYKYYVNNNDSILLKDSGIITYIGEKEGYGNTIIVQQSNGYYAWYGNVKESIKLYDYIESNEEIGSSISNFYYYVLYKDEVPILNEN